MERYTPAVQEKLYSTAKQRKQELSLAISGEFFEAQEQLNSQIFGETWLKDNSDSEWILLKRSEKIQYKQFVQLNKSSVLEYKLEQKQVIRFEFYIKTTDQEYLQGFHQTKIGDLIGTKGLYYKGDLIDPTLNKVSGQLSLTMKSMKKSNCTVIINLSAVKLKSKRELLGLKSADHPFLIVKRQGLSNIEQKDAFETIWKTNHKKEFTINPSWNLGENSFEDLCNSNLDTSLKFEIWCYQKNGNHRLYGTLTSTVSDLIKNEGEELDLINKHGKPDGKLIFNNFQIVSHPTMMDFIRSGWNMSLSVAIDFTASNKALDNPESLHYIDPNNPSKLTVYEEIITSIGSVVEDYNMNEAKYVALGYGGIPYYMGIDSNGNCFSLNGTDNPDVEGVKGILESYRSTIKHKTGLAGPTNFGGCLKVMNNYITDREECSDYHIMLFVTDGTMADSHATLYEVVNASKLPMSIIVVGVGNEDFKTMEELDPKLGVLGDFSDRFCERDTIKFVNHNKFLDDKAGFVQECLKEIPLQFAHHMMNKRITPSPVIHPDINQLV